MSRSALTSLFMATVIMVVAMSVMLVAPLGSGTRSTDAIFVLVFAFAISAWQLTMTAITPRPAAASMMAHVFFVFFLIVPTLFQLATNTFALDMSIYSETTATKAAILVLLFVIAFVLFAAAVAVATILVFGLDTLMANRTSVENYMAEEESKAAPGCSSISPGRSPFALRSRCSTFWAAGLDDVAATGGL